MKYSLCAKVSIGPITRQGNIPQTPSSFKIKHQHHPLILYIFNNFKIRTPRISLPFRISQNQHAVEPSTNAVVRRNNTYFVYFIDYDVKKKFLLLALVLFLLHLMNCFDIESLAYIACVLQQLLQTPPAVLIEIYFVVMRTLLALVVTILYTLYTVACVQIQLQWSFQSFSSYLSEALATTV